MQAKSDHGKSSKRKRVSERVDVDLTRKSSESPERDAAKVSALDEDMPPLDLQPKRQRCVELITCSDHSFLAVSVPWELATNIGPKM